MKRIDQALLWTAGVLALAIVTFNGGSRFKAFCADEDANDAAQVCSESQDQMRSAQLNRKFQAEIDTFARQASHFMPPATVRAVIETVKNEADSDITTDLILRLIARESRFNPLAVGREGEIGLTQIKPHIAALHGYSRADLFDPIKNVKAGSRELKRLVRVMHSRDLALATYAGGPTPAIYYARDIKGK